VFITVLVVGAVSILVKILVAVLVAVVVVRRVKGAMTVVVTTGVV
jgi:hypothetical protein